MQVNENPAFAQWRRWVFLIWLLTSIVFIVLRWRGIVGYALPDTDDNMRMAQVRALLNGQGWYDLRQYKLNPPQGFNIHWSRLVDLPIAAIQLIVKPFFGVVIAQKTSAAIAPLLPLGVVLGALALTARRLIAPASFAIAVGLALLPQDAMRMFWPLRVDHHGWQLAFLTITIAGLADKKSWRGGLTMGLSSAASLAIGLELVPFLVICGAAVVLRWVEQRDEAWRMRGYGIALGGGCTVGYLVFASYDNAVARCDVLSPVWLSTMVVAGALCVVLSYLRAERWLVRLAAAAFGGALIAAAFAYAWPQCLGRPEQISPELYKLWFSNVREAKPITKQGWSAALGVAVLPVIGVIGSLWAVWSARRTDRFAVWLPVALVSMVSALLLFWQMRAGPAAQLMAIPGATALAWAILPRLAWHRLMAVRTLGVIAAVLVISGAAVTLALPHLPGDKPTARTKLINRANFLCPSLAAMKPVAQLPATTIFTFVDLGPRLINVTHHKAVAGPYHRNGDAILDVHHAFGGSPEDARAIMLRHGATLLMTCPNMSEATVHRARHPNGFYGRLAKGERFDWLTPVPMPQGSPLLVWKIR
jgi:hypothetical protein